ncbi:hypothetical protein GQ457_09G028010 [Hibiscus cannabinus]
MSAFSHAPPIASPTAVVARFRWVPTTSRKLRPDRSHLQFSFQAFSVVDRESIDSSLVTPISVFFSLRRASMKFRMNGGVRRQKNLISRRRKKKGKVIKAIFLVLFENQLTFSVIDLIQEIQKIEEKRKQSEFHLIYPKHLIL